MSESSIFCRLKPRSAKISGYSELPELGDSQFRRSLYFVKDMKAGDVITEDRVRSVRPEYGLAPKEFGAIIGQKFTKSIKKICL